MIRATLAVAALLFAGPASAGVLAHRLDSLTLAGEPVSGARVVQGDLRVQASRGWLWRR